MTLPELLNDLNISFLESGHKHCRANWLQLEKCPFCGSDNYHLGINLSSLAGSCWRCGKHTVSEVLKEHGIPSKKAWALYKFLSGDSRTAVETPRIGLVEPKGRGPLLGAHKRYLKSRGFNWEEVQKTWSIEGIGLHAKLGWRIYIPISEKNRRVSWTTRSISPDAEQRYISASAEQESVNHKHVIYGAEMARQAIIIVEGPTDAWNVGPGAGAVFGTAFTDHQVLKLSQFPFRYVCFDNAPTAQKVANDLAGQLSCFPGVTENIVLDAEDPGSASAKEIKQLRKHCNVWTQ